MGISLREYMANKKVVVRSSGIAVYRNTHCFAYSLDDGLVEMKCHYTARDQTVSPICVPCLHLIICTCTEVWLQ